MSLARVTALRRQTELTGIDFVRVHSDDQRTLHVHFLIDLGPMLDLTAEAVSIRSATADPGVADVPVLRADHREIDGRSVLEIETAFAGDFSDYQLALDHQRVDRLLGRIIFNFKQGCPSRLDCRSVDPECPPDELAGARIDYQARDFGSLNRALLDFAAQRYPDWAERIEADVGVMLLELMSSLGDELSYIQDRYAREAYLATATQRRSVRGHSRLVDYELHRGNAAEASLVVQLSGDGGLWLDFGQRVWAPGAGDEDAPIPFSLGRGLATRGDRHWVHPRWNDLPAFIADGDQPCLERGATEVLLRGHVPIADELPAGVGDDSERARRAWLGRDVMLRTESDDPSRPLRWHLVTITGVEHAVDPLMLDDDDQPTPYTRLTWDKGQTLLHDMALSELRADGNVVWATAGETVTEYFHIGELAAPIDVSAPVTRAAEHTGAFDGESAPVPIFRYSPAMTRERGLSWLRPRDATRLPPDASDPHNLRSSTPEIAVTELDPTDPTREIEQWQWRRSILDATSFDAAFAVEDGTWAEVISFHRAGRTITHTDYANGAGSTIRFGDGEFGRVPARGSLFRVTYRTGPGRDANVARHSVTLLEHPRTAERDLPDRVTSVGNPMAVNTGMDTQQLDSAKRLAPDAFRAVVHRAVTEGDYRTMAERLPWVQRAGARFRWTGSWTSVFATADPDDGSALTPTDRDSLHRQLDRVRQAGRDVLVHSPRYVDLDLKVAVCVEASAYAGQVRAMVMEMLVPRGQPHRRDAFFHPDNFSFGDGLSRSALEAAVHAVPGVAGVTSIEIRARGRFDWRPFDEMVLQVSPREVIRVDHDPAFPGRGSVEVDASDGLQPENGDSP